MEGRHPLLTLARSLFRSFPARIYLYVVAPLLGFGAVLTVLFIQSQSRTLEEQLRREGTNVAALLSHVLNLPLLEADRAFLEDITAGASGRPEVAAISVFDEQQKLVLRKRGAGFDPAHSTWPDERDASRAAAAPRLLADAGPDRLTLWAPVYARDTGSQALHSAARGRPRGLVAVTVSPHALEAARRAVVTRSVLALFAFSTLAAFITLLAVQEAAKPLDRLLERVKALGLPSPVARDEVGVLSDSFSHLVDALRRAFTEVAELNRDLERKVSERTAELAAANAELVAARDHLEERARERTLELEQTHRQLLHAEKMGAVGRIAASLAHEINNPVFAVRNVLESLRGSARLDEEERALATAAAEECTRLAKLIRDLQSFNRPSSGSRSVVQIEQVLDAVLLLCRKELSVRRVTVETAYAADLPSVWAVADQMKQVFLNLFTNALDAMTATGGTLRVETEATGGEVRVHVRDTGTGIQPEHLSRLFEPFFTTKPEVKGSGLGLSISNRIVQNHGGSLSVESRPGEGTRVTVRLPIPTGETP